MELIKDILKRRPPEGFALPSESRSTDEVAQQADSNCPICHGKVWVYGMENGYINYSRAVRCRCMKEKDDARRQAQYRKFCKLPEDAATMSLDKFKIQDGKNIYPSLVDALRIAKEMAEGKGDVRWLTLMAFRDRGKSYLAKCICKRWLERGQSARYTSVPDLLIELRASFKNSGEQGYYSLYQFFCKVSLLVLDDLGMEHHNNDNDWAMEQLESIVNNRYENELYMIVTTNKAMDEISPRIASRLQRYSKSRIAVLDESPEYRLWRNK